MSEIALVAAIRPNVYGSSTTGVKKSIVVTSATSSETRHTAASSRDSLPTSRSGGRTAAGIPASTADSEPAGSLQAQPAPWESSVSRIWVATPAGYRRYPQAVPEIDPEQAAERVKKLIIVGDNRLKQGGDDKFAKARGTFEQALRLAEEAGIDERFRPFIERRLESIEQLAGEA